MRRGIDKQRGELLLGVVGLLLLRGLLGVARVRLSGWGRSWVSLSWSGLVRHVVLTIAIGVVAHRHLVVSV